MRSSQDGWIVTKAAVPSARCKVCPRSLLIVTDGASEQAARRRRAERDDRHRLHQRTLDVEPDLAALNFVSVGPLVQPTLAPHLMLEMLHRVSDENLRTWNSCLRQRPVENAPGRADERLAGNIFLVAGLLADEHDVGGPAPLAPHRLRGVLVERTARAFILRLAKLRQRTDRWSKLEVELHPLSPPRLLTHPLPHQRPRHRGSSAGRRIRSGLDTKRC